MTPTIVFDFDGTLALGDGPIAAFARAIAERTGDAAFPARAEAALAAFATGEAEYRDGYDAVTRVARAEGVSPEVIGAAYDASRALLGSPDAAVTAPDELAAFLARVGAHARLLLATNAPGDGVTAVLEEWGVAEVFDTLHFAVGKPDGLVPVLQDALARGPVLAVGDIVEFDLAPATQLGADTALVGATAARSTAAATMRGRTLADLYPQIQAWAEAAASTPVLSSSYQESLPTERHN
ncbi:HAD family hydrolase [Microbacterium sp. NPDC056044]|uniref:HAD family hydrolase n=1 Tax=Microbacterium sp. NPDC056044 TaxID=3345690 RepID=UPI0035DC38B8